MPICLTCIASNEQDFDDSVLALPAQTIHDSNVSIPDTKLNKWECPSDLSQADPFELPTGLAHQILEVVTAINWPKQARAPVVKSGGYGATIGLTADNSGPLLRTSGR